MSPTAACDIRPYRVEDEGEVLRLLEATLGEGPAGRRAPDLFRWKHRENPFGPSYMLVAEAQGRIVGLRAFLRWRFRARDRVVRAVRAVDTATHPDHQGRGIFSQLTRRAVDELRAETDLIFNTPNEKSLPGYLKMGWRTLGTVPVDVRLRRPLRVARALRRLRESDGATSTQPDVRAESALDALLDPGIPILLSEAEEASDARLVTPRTSAYLAWRYGSVPLLDYRAVLEHAGGDLVGIALFRVRSRGALWETTVGEVLVRPGDARTARRLLENVVRAAPVDHAACHFPRGSASRKGARLTGFVRTPRGPTMVVNPLHTIYPDPVDASSWALSLGDLEVF